MHIPNIIRKGSFIACLLAASLSAGAAQTQSLQQASSNVPVPEQINTSETTAGPELVVNADSNKVFGQNLFDGGFRKVAFKGFNQNYRIAIGDKITLQMWGAYEVTADLTVDAQGNIFIPQVGPVLLQGVANKDLNRVVAKKVGSVYQSNVNLYASLNATQPVKLFVTGFVARPGLYGGFASDSALAFLASAGGIRSESGSYLNVELKRNGETRTTFNLYDFLLRGQIEQVQLQDGDTLVVGSRQSIVSFDGLVENPVQIEFADSQMPIKQALNIVGLLPEATHVRIVRNQTSKRNVEYLPLKQVDNVVLQSGDEVTVVSDKMPGTISVAVEGEHNGQAIYVLPYGSTIKTLETNLKLNNRSKYQALQLFRKEVAERQKEVLEISLQQLEQVTLSARSSTDGEANLRKADAESILKFIDRARKLQPRGQVLLGKSEQKNNVLLKDGDRLVIPGETVLVQVYGEVMFPNAMVFRENANLIEYIESAGGFNQKADQSRLLVMHQDGTITRIEKKNGWFSDGYAKVEIQPGDEIMVMPQVDIKSFQYTRDVIDTIYKVALSTAVVAGL